MIILGFSRWLHWLSTVVCRENLRSTPHELEMRHETREKHLLGMYLAQNSERVWCGIQKSEPPKTARVLRMELERKLKRIFRFAFAYGAIFTHGLFPSFPHFSAHYSLLAFSFVCRASECVCVRALSSWRKLNLCAHRTQYSRCQP